MAHLHDSPRPHRRAAPAGLGALEERGPEEERDGEGRGLARWIRPFFEEPSLWPVLVAVVGSLVAFISGLLLLALRGGNVFGMAGVAILAIMSVDLTVRDWRAQGRPGLVGGCILGLWVLVGLASWGAVALGLF